MSVDRPYPPPEGWKTIERIPKAACTWTCEHHAIDQKPRDMVAKKIEKAERELAILKKQFEIIDKPEAEGPHESVYNYDYKIKGLSRAKYQALVEALDHEELQEATRRGLKDRKTFLKFPHCLTNTCDNTNFYIDEYKYNKVGRSEYEDTISKTGLEMVKASQQYRTNCGEM